MQYTKVIVFCNVFIELIYGIFTNIRWNQSELRNLQVRKREKESEITIGCVLF